MCPALPSPVARSSASATFVAARRLKGLHVPFSPVLDIHRFDAIWNWRLDKVDLDGLSAGKRYARDGTRPTIEQDVLSLALPDLALVREFDVDAARRVQGDRKSKRQFAAARK